MFYHQEPNPVLVASTLTMVIPMTIAAAKQIWPTYASFLFLTSASTVYHLTKNPMVYWADQLGCYLISIFSLLDGWNAGTLALTISISTNLIVGYLYHYGRSRQSMIWSKDFWEATTAHFGMHILVTLGYILVLWLHPGTGRQAIH
jgi:hypothetical protein